ncbi:ABC transporter permease [Streptomyces aureocirculatus]|uniref:ABC transporter permease n=1 Tax=Streptomyces aureocirculatus TaxID=67275 RepID=UPI0004CC158F|nr:ABC transporter permease [Streptomyces aureocirculatus]
MRQRPSPAAQLVLTRLRTYYREPGSVFWTFLSPVLLALVLGVAFTDRPNEPIEVAVRDAPGAGRTVSMLNTDPQLQARPLDRTAADADLRSGAVALVVVPGDPPEFHYDPRRTESRLARELAATALGTRRSGAPATAPGETPAATTTTPEVNTAVDVAERAPGSRYVDFLIPGLIGMGLMSSGLWGVGFSIAEIRLRKVLKRLVATPMRRSQFLLSFVVVRASFLLLELPLLVGCGVLVFDTPVVGSFALLLLLTALGAFVFAGIGLLAAARASNYQTVSGILSVVSMPMYIGSGVFFPASHFPDALQGLVQALPLTTLNDALRGVMLEGQTLADVAVPVAVLALWALGSFAAALWLFRWSD